MGIREKLSARLEGTFSGAERDLQLAFTRAQAEAADTGALNGSGFGIVLVGVFEPILTEAVRQGLVSCDLAANRPFGRKHLEILREKITQAAEAAVKIATPKSNAFPNPWAAVVAREMPQMRDRLLRLVEQHETGLASTGAQRPFEPWWRRDPWARAMFFVLGGVVAELLRQAVHAFTP